MKILLTNDDSIHAPGFAVLEDIARQLSDDVWCVAPEMDRSGVAHSITELEPLRVKQYGERRWSVRGTPADCVLLAIRALLPEAPDLILSGVNSGANMGNDVLYSGTVAAAMEGRFLHRPAFAFSLLSKKTTHLPTAAHFARLLVGGQERLHLPPRTVLNVNIPDLPLEQIRGIRITRLGQRRRAAAPLPHVNPRGKQGFWLAVAGEAEDGSEGTDFHAVQQGFVSITPLQIGHRELPVAELGAWLLELAP